MRKTTSRWLWLFAALFLLFAFVFTSSLVLAADLFNLEDMTMQSTYGFEVDADQVRLMEPAYLIYSKTQAGVDYLATFESLPVDGFIKLTKNGEPDVITYAQYHLDKWNNGNNYLTDDITYWQGNIYKACADNNNQEPAETATTCTTNKWMRLATGAIPFYFTQTATNNYVIQAGDVVDSTFMDELPADPPPPTPGEITERDKHLIALSMATFIGWLTIKQFRFRTHD